MTHKILKSALAPPPVTFDQAQQAFGNLVGKYLHELRAWHDHDLQVKTLQPMRPLPRPSDHAEAEDPSTAFWKDTAAWQVEKGSRHEPYPRPSAHPDIVAAVATITGADGGITYVPDFEIVDDDPTPEQILAVKKATLLHAVCQAEANALKAVQLPAGKQRAAQLLEIDIRDKDNQAAVELLADAKAKNIDVANIDVAAEVDKRRDAKLTQHLADQESRRVKVDAIVRAAAQVMSDIEDLTTADVDSFTIPGRWLID